MPSIEELRRHQSQPAAAPEVITREDAEKWAGQKLSKLMLGTRFHNRTYNGVIREALEDDSAHWLHLTPSQRKEVEFWIRGNR